MNNMETLIKENTALTREVKEILDLGKNFFKILHILGRVFKWVATIGAGFAAILTLWHNLPPPGGK